MPDQQPNDPSLDMAEVRQILTQIRGELYKTGDKMDRMGERVGKIDGKVTDMSAVIFGDPSRGIEQGLIQQVKTLRNQMDEAADERLVQRSWLKALAWVGSLLGLGTVAQWLTQLADLWK